MKTDDLIAMLAADAPAVDRAAPSRRFALALLVGLAGATILMATVLGLRPDLATALASVMFWCRLLFAAAMVVAALGVTVRLARPGVRVGGAWGGLAAPLFLAWALAGVVVWHASAGTTLALWLGHTWRVCPVLIATLSVPGLVANFWAMQRMAPVRPRLAGAAAGLLAGATGTVAYCLHCPEMAPPFWACWYVVGMLVPAGIGALVGPRALRW
jgi:hypothetical protein